MKFMVLFFSILLSLSSFAQETRMKMPEPPPDRGALRFYLLNLEMRYEKDSSQDYIDRKPRSFSIGYQWTRWSFLMEYARFSEDTGNSTSSIERIHQELLGWGRYHFFDVKNTSEKMKFSLYGGVGGGGYTEEVETTLMGVSRTDKSDAKFISGAALGAEISLLPNPKFGFVAALEGRALFASDFDPNPLWSAIIRTGIQFIF